MIAALAPAPERLTDAAFLALFGKALALIALALVFAYWLSFKGKDRT